MNDTEARAHFSMCCILAAPLIVGNDIGFMNAQTKAILTNKELIAVDQDQLGVQRRRVENDGDLEVWSKQMSDGGRAVSLLNRGESEEQISVKWQEIGYPESLKASVRDLWTGDTGARSGDYTNFVPSRPPL